MVLLTTIKLEGQNNYICHVLNLVRHTIPTLHRALVYIGVCLAWMEVRAQPMTLRGEVNSHGVPVPFATVHLAGTTHGAVTDTAGAFWIGGMVPGSYRVRVSAMGYLPSEQALMLSSGDTIELSFQLEPDAALEEVVVSGTLKPVSRLASPVPVEVFSSAYFSANPVPSLFDALHQVNGVRPQVNCNVCNTGDIHINGMEGPYSLVLIDGMPVMGGLSSVYGLQAIPMALVDRIEVIKGPASTLYGSEAVGGLINVITRSPDRAPRLAVETFATTGGEVNADVGGLIRPSPGIRVLAGLNLFHLDHPVDRDDDGFTDVAQQDRISVFTKWSFSRSDDRPFTIGGRYVHEDRWGGEKAWTPAFRGGDSLYAESIRTRRWELFGEYRLPWTETFLFRFSATSHAQNSAYGNTSFIARQHTSFGQLTWDHSWSHHDLTLGLAIRHTGYDDNTPATTLGPSRVWLPGIFIQDEWRAGSRHTFLTGLRYDLHPVHGGILSPRLGYKWASSCQDAILRITAGNGFRVAHVFTEDHAALTGSREVVFLEALRPERSWNANINFTKRMFLNTGSLLQVDASIFYTRFSNKIVPDYDTDPDKILYANLEGHGISRGISLNLELSANRLDIFLGGTVLDVTTSENGRQEQAFFTERFSGVWRIRYAFRRAGLLFDYTGNLYSPMRLPRAGPADPREDYAPWWSQQNIQLTRRFQNGLELFAGVKNLLDWTPAKAHPFLIARSHDPFDAGVQFDTEGRPLVLPDNPYGLTFDTTYAYAPNQGRRWFFGCRLSLAP